MPRGVGVDCEWIKWCDGTEQQLAWATSPEEPRDIENGCRLIEGSDDIIHSDCDQVFDFLELKGAFYLTVYGF